MIKQALFIIAFVCIFSNAVLASESTGSLELNLMSEISNPQKISEMGASVLQNGIIKVSGDVKKINFNLSIPQNRENQRVVSIDANHEYKIVTDKYGNQLMSFVWENPKNDIILTVKTNVVVERKKDYPAMSNKDYLTATKLIQSGSEIVKNISLTFAGNDLEKIAKIVKWVHENIEYDTKFVTSNMCAEDILELRRGTCDEFSTLTLALTRSLGYPSSYIAGYAYTKDGFVPHGWVEVYTDHTIDADPTWGQANFLDATHIKFANLHESLYAEAVFGAEGYGDFNVKIEKLDTNIAILSTKEDPLIDLNSELLDDKIVNGYAVVKNELTYSGCVLTGIESHGCTNNGDEFVKPLTKEQIVYFCDSKNIFSIYEVPEVGNNVYMCTLTTANYAGEDKTVEMKMGAGTIPKVDLIVDKNILEPSEEYKVNAANAHIFTDNGDYAYSAGTFKSGNEDFYVYAYKSGALQKQFIKVIDVKPVDVSIATNKSYYIGQLVSFDIIVDNLLDKNQKVKIMFRDQTKEFDLSGTERINFQYMPEGLNDNMLIISIETDGFSTIITRSISLSKKLSMFESFFNMVKSIFS